jgi:hypothetical protein
LVGPVAVWEPMGTGSSFCPTGRLTLTNSLSSVSLLLPMVIRNFVKLILLCCPPASTLVSCSAHSSTLKMEETRSSGTSVDFQRTAWYCDVLA